MKKQLLLCLSLLACIGCGDDNSNYDEVVMEPVAIEIKSDLTVYKAGGTTLPFLSDVQNFCAREYYKKTDTGFIYYNSAFRTPTLHDYCNEKNNISFIAPGQPQVFFHSREIVRDGENYIMVTNLTNKYEDNIPVKEGMFKYPYRPADTDGKTFYMQYVGRGNEQVFYLSLLSYKWVRYDENNNFINVETWIEWNRFNPNFIESLGVNDTLAIQEFELRYHPLKSNIDTSTEDKRGR